jgi:hypothetical protein
VVVAVSEVAAPWPELDSWVGEKTGEEAGESSKDETALFRLLTRESEGDEMGDTSWSRSGISMVGIFGERLGDPRPLKL